MIASIIGTGHLCNEVGCSACSCTLSKGRKEQYKKIKLTTSVKTGFREVWLPYNIVKSMHVFKIGRSMGATYLLSCIPLKARKHQTRLTECCYSHMIHVRHLT